MQAGVLDMKVAGFRSTGFAYEHCTNFGDGSQHWHLKSLRDLIRCHRLAAAPHLSQYGVIPKPLSAQF
jgi:hypothetical protein